MWTIDLSMSVSEIEKRWTKMLRKDPPFGNGGGHLVSRTVIPEGYAIPFDFREKLMGLVFIPIAS